MADSTMSAENTITPTVFEPRSLYPDLASGPNSTNRIVNPPQNEAPIVTVVAIAVPLIVLIAVSIAAFLLVQRRKRGNRSNDTMTQTKSPPSISSVDLQLARKHQPANRNCNLELEAQYTQLDRYGSAPLKAGDYIQKELGEQYLSVLSERPSSQHFPGREPSSRAFDRSAPARRSNSLGSLPLRPAAKNLTMKSQDSGFSSDMSLAMSPGSPVSSTQLFGPCTDHNAHSQAAMKNFIQDAVNRFLSDPSRIVGVCYASRIFAIGKFDHSGGTLRLANSQDAKLVIPPGALSSTQLVYFMVQFENNNNDDFTINYSPTFECGPDGLQFEVPVQLTIPHTAVDTNVVALTREGNSGWTEDSRADGAAIVQADVETVTLSIKHFTGYKLSDCHGNATTSLNRACRSRIPVRVQGTGGQRRLTTQQPGKKLSVSVFKKGDKARIYVIGNSKSTHIHTFVDESERSLQFTRDTHWKDFTYVRGKGSLIIETLVTKKRRKTIYKRFTFSEDQVLSKNYEYVELISSEQTLILDVHFYQQSDADNVTQFSIKLEKLRSPPSSLAPYEHTHLKTMQTWMNGQLVDQRPNSMSSMRCLAPSYLPRSISEVPTPQHSPTRRPQETCDHTNGACNCWREGHSRQPEESDYDASACQPPNELRRGVNNRRSKESGYESSVQSPVSPLKGPDSLSVNDSMAPGSSPSDLTLNTVGSESYSSQPNYIQNTHL